jgi:hypothetical protein
MMAKLKRNKRIVVKNLSFNAFSKWLHDSYDFTMSDVAYDFVQKQSSGGKPVHVMKWSPERGDVFIRLVDTENGAEIQYQITTTTPAASKWVTVPLLNDIEGEEREDFHVVNGIRQEFRKSIYGV